MFFFHLWPLKLNTPLTKCIFMFHVCSALILHLGATSSLGKLLQNIVIVGYSFVHIWSLFSVGIEYQMSMSTSEFLRQTILPSHDFRVVRRVEKGEDRLLRISDEIRMNKETPHVAVSTLVSRKNSGSQFLSENVL